MEQDRSEYPTRKDLEDALEAHEKGRDSLLEWLRRKRIERQDACTTKGLHSMPKNQYPTPELLQRYLEAYQEEGEAGIRRILREQREAKDYVSNLIEKHMVEYEKDHPRPESLKKLLE